MSNLYAFKAPAQHPKQMSCLGYQEHEDLDAAHECFLFLSPCQGLQRTPLRVELDVYSVLHVGTQN